MDYFESKFKSDLAKSAFHDKIYEPLPLSYYKPFIISTHRILQAYNIHPKLYQAHDAFLMHYKPYHLVYQSLKKSNKASPLWRAIVEKTLKSEEFLDLNRITAGSSELSIVATVKFLKSILERADVEEMQRRLKKNMAEQSRQKQQGASSQAMQQPLEQVASEVFSNTVIGEAIENAMNAVKEYKGAR